MTPEISELVKTIRGWARAYRETPEHRFPSDPNAEFFPVDLDCAADALTRLSERIADAEKVLTDPAAFHLHALRNNILSRMNALHIAGATDYDSLKTRLAQAVQNFEAIRQATIDGRVCDDIAWFDTITTLHDFCELAILNARVSSPVTEKTDG